MRIIAFFIVALALPMSFASAAEATRPLPGYNYPDQCKNIPGVQGIYMLVGTGPYRHKGNPAKKVCVRIYK